MSFTDLDKNVLSKSMDQPGNRFNVDWNKIGTKDKPLWSTERKESVAIAVCKNAIVIANKSEIVALSLKDGGIIWSQPIPSSPVPWGLAVDRNGNVVVSLENGQILCFGSRRQA